MDQTKTIYDLSDKYQVVSGSSPQPQQERGFLRETLGNVPSSAGRLISDTFSAVTNPIDTVKGIGSVIKGAGEAAGRGIVGAFDEDRASLVPQSSSEQTFRGFTEFMKQRYGSVDQIKNTLKEDPVGLLADVSALLTGGGATLRGAGTATRAASFAKSGTALVSAGKVLQKAGLVSEPLNLIGKAAFISTKPARVLGGAVLRGSLGVTTGVGGDVIRAAFNSKSREFTDALRGRTNVDNILTHARDALHSIKETRASDYRRSLLDIKTQKGGISMSGLRSYVDDVAKEFRLKKTNDGFDLSGSAIADAGEQRRVQTVLEEVLKWEDNSPIGLDTLKQRLDDFYTPSGPGSAIIGKVRSRLNKTLSSKVPGYSEMTKKYADATKLIKEIEGTLSLGVGARADTTIKKLMSALRQNNEYRQALLSVIDEKTPVNLTESLAGSALSPVVPSGLVGRSIFAGGLTGGAAGLAGLAAINPAVLWGLAFTSPRVVGEMLRALGMSKRAVETAMSFITSDVGRELLQISFQGSRITDLEDQQE